MTVAVFVWPHILHGMYPEGACHEVPLEILIARWKAMLIGFRQNTRQVKIKWAIYGETISDLRAGMKGNLSLLLPSNRSYHSDTLQQQVQQTHWKYAPWLLTSQKTGFTVCINALSLYTSSSQPRRTIPSVVSTSPSRDKPRLPPLFFSNLPRETHVLGLCLGQKSWFAGHGQ